MNGGWTGTNNDRIVSKLNQIQTSYESLMQALHDRTQTEFIDQMAEEWACRYAQEFFNNSVKPVFDEMLDGSYKTYQNIVETIDAWATNWATQTGSDWSKISFNGELKNVNVDNIKENINGDRGIKEAEANETAESLVKIEADVNSAVSDAENAVHDCGFLDPSGNMETNLINSLNKIKSKFEEAIAEIRESFKNYVSKTTEDYATLASKNAEAFTIHEG